MILRRITRKAPSSPKPFIHPDGEYTATLKLIQESVLYGKNTAKLTFSTTEGQISLHWEVNNELMSKFDRLAGLGGFTAESDVEIYDLININVTLSINYSKITKIY